MKIFLACGGSGGHIFPGVALAQTLAKKLPEAEIVFVGTPRGLEQKLLAGMPWRLEMIQAVSIADKRGFAKLAAAFSFVIALSSAFKILRAEKPSVAVGLGGYVAAPILMMAWLLRVPTVAIEPNAIPGLANRFLKYFVQRVIVAFPNLEKWFGKKARCLGVPIREEIVAQARSAVKGSKTAVLVLGGSQGALALNQLIRDSLPFLEGLKNQIYFIHHAGDKENCAALRKAYQNHGIEAEVSPFIAKIGEAYGRADFIVARAGANVVAEVIALKIPTLFIPYPLAGGHQAFNARHLAELGAAKLLTESQANGEKIAKILLEILSSPEKLKKMRNSFPDRQIAEVNGRIAEACLELAAHA